MVDYDLRRSLIDVAKLRETISYSELRLDAPQALAAPLDEINRHEHREGRPLLSAVVAHKDGDRMSGDGFSRSGGNLRSTRKETQSCSGGENWSRCGTIDRPIDGDSSFI